MRGEVVLREQLAPFRDRFDELPQDDPRRDVLFRADGLGHIDRSFGRLNQVLKGYKSRTARAKFQVDLKKVRAHDRWVGTLDCEHRVSPCSAQVCAKSWQKHLDRYGQWRGHNGPRPLGDCGSRASLASPR